MGNLRTSEDTILELRKRKNAGTKLEVEDVGTPETRSGKESPIKTERELGPSIEEGDASVEEKTSAVEEQEPDQHNNTAAGGQGH
jgi:hypothetical protein